MTFAVVPGAARCSPSSPRSGSRWSPPRTMTGGGSRQREALARSPGMAMTEKQGGSDVRANTTAGEAINGGGPGGEYLT